MPRNKGNQAKMIRIGSRTSQLALIQTNMVADMLKQDHPELDVRIITMDTIGDKVLDVALSKIGDKSLFTKELEIALVKKEVDFVVHSFKDMPTTVPPGLVIGSVCNRDWPSDAVVMAPKFRGLRLADLPEGSVIGTSAVRRIALLKRAYPQLKFLSVRGNLNTRLLKLDTPLEAKALGKGDGQEYAALILADAGMKRMGWEDRIDEVLDGSSSLYAVAQGALACECRTDDASTLALLSSIHDESAALTCIAERALMRRLEGGCSTPVGVNAKLTGDWKLTLTGAVLSVNGEQCVQDTMDCALPLVVEEPPAKMRKLESQIKDEPCVDKDDEFVGVKVHPICDIGLLRMARARQLGCDVAGALLAAGGDKILAEIKTNEEAERRAKTEKAASPVKIQDGKESLDVAC